MSNSIFESETYQQRFGGIARLYGVEGLQAFANAKVMVIGIGGVGTWVAESLARSGIGAIQLMDLDDVCVTNTNRQIHALTSTIGQSKVAVMAERIKAINPLCDVTELEDFIAADNLSEYLSAENAPDYVIDCIDAVKPKAALIAWCKRNKIKIVTIGGAGGQIDPAQVKASDLSKTIQDPLLAKVRSLLRKEYGFSQNPQRKFSIDAIFSTEHLKYPKADGSVCASKEGITGTMRMDCASGFGAVSVVTGTFGFHAVARVLQKLAAR